MATGKTKPKMYPVSARLEAFLTASWRPWAHSPDLIQMRALISHLPSLLGELTPLSIPETDPDCTRSFYDVVCQADSLFFP